MGAHRPPHGLRRVSDDLVTRGLGADATLGKRPGYADPLHPNAAELRRVALFQSGSAGQEFGRLFRPDVDGTTGQNPPGQGKIAGEKFLACTDGSEGKQNLAMLLQIPANLSSERHRLVAVPVYGSTSLFRDVVGFGFWGLPVDARPSYRCAAGGAWPEFRHRTRRRPGRQHRRDQRGRPDGTTSS
jgi:hydroxybutyrate-dimer hydrolase